MVQKITFATNNQNPVDLRDLKANDERQAQLELDIAQLGYRYLRKRSSERPTQQDITSSEAAAAVLAVWRKAPHQAKSSTREHFGKLYNRIFTSNLNGTQIISATLLSRIADSRHRQPANNDPDFVRYASYFIAMQMGKYLLRDLKLQRVDDLNHQHFLRVQELIQNQGSEYFDRGVKDIEDAIHRLYSASALSLQQLSATFRRGDLISQLADF